MGYRKLFISASKFNFVFGLMLFAYQVARKKLLEKWSPQKTEDIAGCKKEIQRIFDNQGYREESLLALFEQNGIKIEKMANEWEKSSNGVQPPAKRTLLRLNVLIEANKETLGDVVLDVAPSFGWYIVGPGDPEYRADINQEPEIWKLSELVQNGKITKAHLK